MDYEKELRFAKGLAQKAGEVIRAEFHKVQASTLKSDASLVTAVDKQVNDLVRVGVQEEFPSDAFDGEEGKGGDESSDRVWICDPIDGTNSFILSVPACMFVLGLHVAGAWQIAVAYNPMTNELYEAVTGKGAYKNGGPIAVGNASSAEHPFIVIDAKVYRELPAVVAQLESQGYQIVGVNGTASKVVKVAEGLAAGIFRGKGDYHDIGVSSLIASEAGAVVSSLRGGALMSDGLDIEGGFIIANPTAHADILEALKPYPE